LAALMIFSAFDFLRRVRNGPIFISILIVSALYNHFFCRITKRTDVYA
jgi:hypothetical protein